MVMSGIMQDLVILSLKGSKPSVLLERHASNFQRGIGLHRACDDLSKLVFTDDTLWKNNDYTAEPTRGLSEVSRREVGEPVAEHEQWRDLALQLSRPTWSEALKGEAQVISVKGKHMVYVGENDILFMLAGAGMDFDELGLHEVVVVLMSALRELLGTLDSDRLVKFFGKVCLVIDQIWEDGSLASTDIAHVLAHSKLKKAVMEV